MKPTGLGSGFVGFAACVVLCVGINHGPQGQERREIKKPSI
jgi:hypothetical protein